MAAFTYLLILLFLALNPHAGSVYAAMGMTLAQGLQAGVDNNPPFQAARLKDDVAGQDIKASRTDSLTGLSSFCTANRTDSLPAQEPIDTDYLKQQAHLLNVGLTQIHCAGSRLVYAYDRAKVLAQVAQAEAPLAGLHLANTLKTTLYKMMMVRQDVGTAAKAVDRPSESGKIAEHLFQKELVPHVEVPKARVDLADVGCQLSIARDNDNRMRGALFSLVNFPDAINGNFVETGHVVIGNEPSWETSFECTDAHRSDLKSLRLQHEVAWKQNQISLGKYMPTVRFDKGDYDQNNDYKELAATLSRADKRDQVNKYWQGGFTVSRGFSGGGSAWSKSDKSELEGQEMIALAKEVQNAISTGTGKALCSTPEAGRRLASVTPAHWLPQMKISKQGKVASRLGTQA